MTRYEVAELIWNELGYVGCCWPHWLEKIEMTLIRHDEELADAVAKAKAASDAFDTALAHLHALLPDVFEIEEEG